MQGRRVRHPHPGAAIGVDPANRRSHPYVPSSQSTQRFQCSSVLAMTCFQLRDYTVLPKKELHVSLWVTTGEGGRRSQNYEEYLARSWRAMRSAIYIDVFGVQDQRAPNHQQILEEVLGLRWPGLHLLTGAFPRTPSTDVSPTLWLKVLTCPLILSCLALQCSECRRDAIQTRAGKRRE